MPAIRIFDVLRKRVLESGGMLPAEKRAMYFFQNYRTELTKWQTRHEGLAFTKLQQEEFTNQLVGPTMGYPGFLYFFCYDAKLKQTLPYWDMFPFTLILQRYDDGYLGLNFHYLPYDWRARFFDALYPYRQSSDPTREILNIKTKLKMTYDILLTSKKFAPFKPCIKRYLSKHITSGGLLKVGAYDWPIALFLPVAQFQKEPKTQVWKESVKKFV